MEKRKRRKVITWSVASIVTSLVLWIYRIWVGKTLETVFVGYFPWNIGLAILVGLTIFILKVVRQHTKNAIQADIGKKNNKNKNSKGQDKKFFMPKGLFIVILIFALPAAIVATKVFSSAFEEKVSTQQTQTKVDQQAKADDKKEGQDQEIPFSRKVLGAVIVLAMISIFIYSAYSQWESGKKLYEQKFWQNTMGVVIYIIISTYLLIAFLLPKVWDFLWRDQIFFWSLTLGIIIFARLRTMKGADEKPLTAAQNGAWVFGFILVCGLATQASTNHNWVDEKAKDANWKFWENGTTTQDFFGQTPAGKTSFDGVPVEVAKRVVCECESGCQQFEPGTMIPYKNRGIPKENIPPSGAFGKYQFKEFHRQIALDLKPSLDLNTEEGQEKYFEYLYGKEGFGPWDHDQKYGGGSACWGPKLLALGYGQSGKGEQTQTQLAILDVPTDRWSDGVPNPSMKKICWGRLDLTKGGECQIMMDKDLRKVYPVGIGGFKGSMIPRVVQFKCSESGAQMEVRGVPNT